ncbi:MAG: cell division FtsK/SpoIIIE [uncultured bacterium]|nr:MAG: cell division FtsK/SpoIIIE [uncultured bacterium]
MNKEGNQGMAGEDELYNEASETVAAAGKASASLLQRRLRIGYARAARLLDILEDNGVIGPADGAKPREVYTSRTENIHDNSNY